jgi:chromate transport protein ChrA
MGSMLRKSSELTGFVIGCLLLVAAFGIGWAKWGNLQNQETIMQVLMATILAVVAFLLVMIGISKGKDRWRAMLLDGILILGFSILLFDIGLLLLPLSLIFMVVSISKLRQPNSPDWQAR